LSISSAKCILRDITGKIWIDRELNAGSNDIPIHDLPMGIYFVEVIDYSIRETFKIIKKE
jgi:hypothetical protein